jgi:hypothetical protein
MVSWIAANASVLYRLAIGVDLLEVVPRDQRAELSVGQVQDVFRSVLERRHLILAKVRSVAFGEAIYEDGALALAKEDDRPEALRFSLSSAGHTLLDDAAAQIGVDLARARCWKVDLTFQLNLALSSRS